MSRRRDPQRLRVPRPEARPKASHRIDRGRTAHRTGHAAEWWAAAWLMLKGYQILGFRLRTRQGEIDLLARKGRALILVEVKRRPDLPTALAALGPVQTARLLAAGRALLRQRPSLQGYSLRLDLIALVPGRFPIHVCNLDQTEIG